MRSRVQQKTADPTARVHAHTHARTETLAPRTRTVQTFWRGSVRAGAGAAERNRGVSQHGAEDDSGGEVRSTAEGISKKKLPAAANPAQWPATPRQSGLVRVRVSCCRVAGRGPRECPAAQLGAARLVSVVGRGRRQERSDGRHGTARDGTGRVGAAAATACTNTDQRASGHRRSRGGRRDGRGSGRGTR